nr:hypothetical protein GCM10020092_044070 [Actinoplanes digitatis]
MTFAVLPVAITRYASARKVYVGRGGVLNAGTSGSTTKAFGRLLDHRDHAQRQQRHGGDHQGRERALPERRDLGLDQQEAGGEGEAGRQDRPAVPPGRREELGDHHGMLRVEGGSMTCLRACW